MISIMNMNKEDMREEFEEEYMRRKSLGKRKITDGILREYLKRGELWLDGVRCGDVSEVSEECKKGLEKEMKKLCKKKLKEGDDEKVVKGRGKKCGDWSVECGDDGNGCECVLDELEYEVLLGRLGGRFEWGEFGVGGDYRKNSVLIRDGESVGCVYDWFNPEKEWKWNRWYMSGEISKGRVLEILSGIEGVVRHKKEPDSEMLRGEGEEGEEGEYDEGGEEEYDEGEGEEEGSVEWDSELDEMTEE